MSGGDAEDGRGRLAGEVSESELRVGERSGVVEAVHGDIDAAVGAGGCGARGAVVAEAGGGRGHQRDRRRGRHLIEVDVIRACGGTRDEDCSASGAVRGGWRVGCAGRIAGEHIAALMGVRGEVGCEGDIVEIAGGEFAVLRGAEDVVAGNGDGAVGSALLPGADFAARRDNALRCDQHVPPSGTDAREGHQVAAFGDAADGVL